MKTNLLLAGALSCALFASGCASTSTTGTTSGLTTQQFVVDAQIAAETLCAIAPTAETITTIALTVAGGAAGMASEQLAETAAAAFCSGVSKLGAKHFGVRLRAAAPNVVDYGSITIAGRSIDLRGTPIS